MAPPPLLLCSGRHPLPPVRRGRGARPGSVRCRAPQEPSPRQACLLLGPRARGSPGSCMRRSGFLLLPGIQPLPCLKETPQGGDCCTGAGQHPPYTQRFYSVGEVKPVLLGPRYLASGVSLHLPQSPVLSPRPAAFGS